MEKKKQSFIVQEQIVTERKLYVYDDALWPDEDTAVGAVFIKFLGVNYLNHERLKDEVYSPQSSTVSKAIALLNKHYEIATEIVDLVKSKL